MNSEFPGFQGNQDSEEFQGHLGMRLHNIPIHDLIIKVASRLQKILNKARHDCNPPMMLVLTRSAKNNTFTSNGGMFV